MSLEDPFFVVKGEVQKALSRARGLFDRWEELLQESTQVSRDELDWSTNELRNCLRAIDWDLEDLSETINILHMVHMVLMLGEFGDEMDQTSSRMDSILKKLEKVSHMTSSRRQWCAIGVLVAIMLVVLILIFALHRGVQPGEVPSGGERAAGEAGLRGTDAAGGAGRRQWCAIGVLVAIMLVVLILIFAL
ncbi:hypothetical protein CRUP_025684 [Coryphaenoides rupestris]|nr:hypothetical protein CRUP_025684 [Coryphaenoides rupestris]